ncbi:MAG TPA: DJ-1/PfpI family protein [Anaeromyxobacteraceae bacterium]|nr:DJ-1/PfpI family protein [Anaeromyxobacteraceae bacterium]
MGEDRIRIAVAAFDGVTPLDAVGPLDVLARLPAVTVVLASRGGRPVRAEFGLELGPGAALEEVAADVLCVPGGPGVNRFLADAAAVDLLARIGGQARWVASVCTGALLLGAAGLLRGYRATTHWLSLDLLPVVEAIPVEERVVVDRNRITSAGVTAGIDLALRLAAELSGVEAARRVGLLVEYDPAPPFGAGSTRTAGPGEAAALREERTALQLERRRLLAAAAERFGPAPG